jgi:PAS domain S-box-containing protein
MLDNSPDLIGRYDRDGRRLFVNRAIADTFGRTPEELVGTLLRDHSLAPGAGLLPESAARLLASIREAFDHGSPVQLEATFLSDGRPLVIHFRVVPELDGDGCVRDVLAIGRDITAVKRIEQELYDSRRSYRDVFDNALDEMALLEICEQGRYRILEINPAMERTMDRPRDEVIGRFQDELFTPEVDRALTARYQACIDAGSPVEGELDLDLPNGRRHYQASTVPARDETGQIVRVVNIVRDITERQRSEHAKQRLDRALRTLSSGNEALIRAVDEPSLLSGMCRAMVQVGGYRRAWIGYPEAAAGAAGVEAAAGASGQGVPGQVVPITWASEDPTETQPAQPDPVWVGPQEPLQEAMVTGVAQVHRPDRGDGPWTAWRKDACQLGIASCLTLPLRHDGGILGVLTIHAEQSEAFEPDELQLLTELAADLAYGIHNLRARAEQSQQEERLRKAMGATIQALADTTELRDPYTAGHQRRVAQLAEAVGRRLGLPEDRVAGLYLASTIHDIGKICVPAEILGRPGGLSPLEYAMVQQHVVAAYELLKGIEFPWPVAEIVGQHHERCDGSGYPGGLTCDQLLTESRILAVCDVVEAMWSHRPYRAGLGMEAALAELQAHRGTKYDAEVVDCCVSMLRQDGFEFR